MYQLRLGTAVYKYIPPVLSCCSGHLYLVWSEFHTLRSSETAVLGSEVVMESSGRPASGGGHVAWLEEAVEGGNDAEWELEVMLRTRSGFHTHVHMLVLGCMKR